MEWSIPVNEYLFDDITKITHTMIPPRFHGDMRALRMVQDSLARVIDSLGEQSSAAQGLNRIITTAEKLHTAPTVNSLYLLKDATAKGGEGEVIGMLRVGRKHLYLYDDHAIVRQVEPLCVLDFYVKSDRQRHGHGRRLFDHMLKEEGVHPLALAIDGPSPKMENFLLKSYGIDRLIRQSNNFAISPHFFASDDISPSGRSTPVASTPAVGRFAAIKPLSSISTVIHGGSGSGSSSRDEARIATPDPESKGAPLSTPAAPESAPVAPETESVAPEPAPVVPEPVPVAPELAPVALEPAPVIPQLESGPKRPNTLEPAITPAGSTVVRRDSQLTDLGFFDVKFYHSKLW